MIRLKLPSLLYGVNLNADRAVLGFVKGHKIALKAHASEQYLEENYRSLDNEEFIAVVLTDSVSCEKSRYCIDEDSLPLTLVRLMSLPEFQMS